MTRNEAEEIIMAVEVGLGKHYGITKAQYIEALLILEAGELEEPVENDCDKLNILFESDCPCPLCGGAVGHRINCPHGIAFSRT